MVSNGLVDMAGRIALQVDFGPVFQRFSAAVIEHFKLGTQQICFVDFNDLPDLPGVQEYVFIVGI